MVAVINGRPTASPPRSEWPSISEAMSIIDSDLSHDGVHIKVTETELGIYRGKLWQEWKRPDGEVEEIGHLEVWTLSYDDVARKIAAIIKPWRSTRPSDVNDSAGVVE